MPLPLVLAAIPAITGLTWAEIGGASVLTALTGLVTDAYKDKPFPSPSFGAPSGLNNVPLTLPTTKPVSGDGFVLSGNAPAVPSIIPKNPSLSPVFDPALEAFRQSKLHGEVTSADSFSALRTKASAVNVQNSTLAQTAGVSPFLVNQVEAKASIDEVAFAINAQTIVHAMTYESLERNLGLLSAALVGIAGLKSMEYEHTENMGHASVSAKVVTDHAQKKKDILDLDDNFVTHVSPMVVQASYYATKARTATETNSEEFDESMFPELSLPILPFIGSSDIFNPLHSTPSINPFTHKNL